MQSSRVCKSYWCQCGLLLRIAWNFLIPAKLLNVCFCKVFYLPSAPTFKFTHKKKGFCSFKWQPNILLAFGHHRWFDLHFMKHWWFALVLQSVQYSGVSLLVKHTIVCEYVSHSLATVCLPTLGQGYAGISLGIRTLLGPTSLQFMDLVSLLQSLFNLGMFTEHTLHTHC